MRLGIASKLALLLTLVGVLALALAASYGYLVSRDLLVGAAKDKLLTSTHVLARRVGVAREEASRMLLTLTGHPATVATLRRSDARLDEQLAVLFEQVMRARPEYLEIRLISAADHGLERVRVERDEQALTRIEGDDLQEKGHFDYVSQALGLPAGQTYMSSIAINHERGTPFTQGRPTVVLAMPVLAPGEAHALGVVVVNLDIRAVFGQLSADLPADIRLFLANAQGDWLIHPDSSKTFGFDRGRRILAQQDFPAVLPLVEGKLDQLVFESPSPIDGVPMVAAFALFPLHIASSERGLILGLAQPLSAVLADVNRPRADLLGFALALALGCIVVAAVLAGAVTRPINAINQAARALAQGEADGLLPLGRSDEIGDLARTFHRMREQISRQVVTLQDHREELEHLAQHDPLTGLPNRRMLQERLDQSIARARRNNESVALLFVDLDRFKEINDRLGHDAGDYVLRVVARRMQGVLREIDTLARLGGDEFVVLLEAPAQGADGLGTVADKIIEQVRLPIPYGAQMLEVGASIGISQYPRDGHLATELIAAADRAMYQAKAEGRDRYKFATR